MEKTLWARVFNSDSDNRKSKIENVIWLGLSVIVFVLVMAGAVVQAQQPTKIPRIGYLGISRATETARIEAFRQGLRELGYMEGKNIVTEYRYFEQKFDRLATLAA